MPDERRALAEAAFVNGDFSSAREQLEVIVSGERPESTPSGTTGVLTVTVNATPTITATALVTTSSGTTATTQLTTTAALTPTLDIGALFQLGVAYLETEDYADAEATLLQVAQLEPARSQAHYFAAQAAERDGRCSDAITHYDAYLDANPDMAAYIQPLIADCHLELGNSEAAKAAYVAAEAAGAHFLQTYANRLALAELYLADEEYAAAADMFRTIRRNAFTTFTQGEMTYRLGATLELAGDLDGALAEYRRAVSDYPTVYSSYEALIRLLDEGVEVEPFQRGFVDYHAGAYFPAIEVLSSYIEDNPDNYRADAHLYLAWSYEGVGDIPSAIDELDTYSSLSATTAPEGMLEKADLLRRQGELAAAQEAYAELFETMPLDERTAAAGHWSAVMLEWLDEPEAAVDAYRDFATAFPDDDRAPEALFRAGWLAYSSRNSEGGIVDWQRAVEAYPASDYGLAAQLWLYRFGEESVDTVATDDTRYFALRLRDLAGARTPFSPEPFDLTNDRVTDQVGAEAWLKAQLGLAQSADIRTLDPDIAFDPMLRRGTKLWQLRRIDEAKRELNQLRELYAEDIIASYQLSLYLHELGVHQSGIGAAVNVLIRTGTNGLSAPPFLAALAFPVPYADLVTRSAAEYELDPLLHFSLIRQESLFATYAASSAAAQGLGQIIPATGEYIAGKLEWPNYRNSDLYRPYVNVPFSAYYLAEQLALFDGDVHAALAAYNAGPGNALRWHAVAGSDIDQFVATIDFAETELYVQNIYRWHAVYQRLYAVQE